MSDPNKDAIVIRELSKSFDNVQAVERLSVEVRTGEIFGLLRPNGAGKTTTIRMLLGLIRPHQGEVSLFGAPLKRRNRALLGRVGALVEIDCVARRP